MAEPSAPIYHTPKTLQEWVARLADSSLPLFRSTATTLAALREEAGIAMDRVCESIPADPGAALALLKKANAVRHRRLGARVSTVENAAMMLGLLQVKVLPDETDVMDPPGDSPDRQGYMRVVSRAYHAALQAHSWAIRRGDMTPKEVFVATFLHDLGEMLLWLRGGGEMHRVNSLMRQERMPPDEAQYVVLGFSLEQLTYELAIRWNLPELLCDSLLPENAQNPRVLEVMLAAQLGRIAESGWYSEEAQQCLENVSEHLGVAFADLVHSVHETAVEAARDTQMYGVRPAAYRLPMLPGEEIWDDEEEPDPTESARQQPAAASTDGQGEADQDAAPQHFCLTPQLARYEEVVQLLETGGEVELDLNLHDLMTLVMDGLHDGIGLNRVVFTMLSRDRGTLIARYLKGTDNDPAFSLFQLALDSPHLFSRLIEKPQSIWVSDANRSRIWPLVPESLKRLIRTNSFFASSVFVGGKPIGLFYADRHLKDSRLDEGAYQRFKRLCQLAAKAIERRQSR